MIICAIGAMEIVIIGAVILLLFGGKKLPELMKGMGKGVKSFKEGMSEPTEEEMNRRVEEEIQRRADAKAAEEDARRAEAHAEHAGKEESDNRAE